MVHHEDGIISPRYTLRVEVGGLNAHFNIRGDIIHFVHRIT